MVPGLPFCCFTGRGAGLAFLLFFTARKAFSLPDTLKQQKGKPGTLTITGHHPAGTIVAGCGNCLSEPLYSYTIHSGPGKSHDSPDRSRSRQFSQLCASRASSKRTSRPCSCNLGSSERFSYISDS